MHLEKSVWIARTVDWILIGLFVTTSVLFIVLLLDLPPRATIFPWFVTGSIVIVSIVYAAGNIANPGRWDAPSRNLDLEGDDEETNAATVGPAVLKGKSPEIIQIFVAVFGLAALITLIGHQIAAPLFMLVYIVIRGEGWWFAIGAAIAVWAFIRFTFIELMEIYFPDPYLFDWLGL